MHCSYCRLWCDSLTFLLSSFPVYLGNDWNEDIKRQHVLCLHWLLAGRALRWMIVFKAIEILSSVLSISALYNRVDLALTPIQPNDTLEQDGVSIFLSLRYFTAFAIGLYFSAVLLFWPFLHLVYVYVHEWIIFFEKKNAEPISVMETTFNAQSRKSELFYIWRQTDQWFFVNLQKSQT